MHKGSEEGQRVWSPLSKGRRSEMRSERGRDPAELCEPGRSLALVVKDTEKGVTPIGLPGQKLCYEAGASDTAPNSEGPSQVVGTSEQVTVVWC